MLAVTAIYASLLGLLFLGLSINVIRFRRRDQVGIGVGDSADLARATRVHGNFSEYVPLLLILLGVLELNIAADWPIHLGGALIVLGRVFHAIGLGKSEGVSKERVTGMMLTFAALLFLSLYNLFIVIMGAIL